MNKKNNPKFNRTKIEKDMISDFRLENLSTVNYYEELIYAYLRTFDRTTDIHERIDACYESISAFNEFRDFCYRSDSGTLYFQDMWEHCHNSRNDCFSFLDSIDKQIDLLNNELEIEQLATNLETEVLNILENKKMIVQSELFKLFDVRLKDKIKEILKEWELYNMIKKTRYKNSYMIELIVWLYNKKMIFKFFKKRTIMMKRVILWKNEAMIKL